MGEILPTENFELMAHAVSLLGSGAAVASTLYFWLVRVNRERPKLDLLPLKPVQGSLMLPQENLAAYRALKPGDEQSIAIRLNGVNSTTFEFNLPGRPDETTATTHSEKPASGELPAMKRAA